MTGYPVGGCAAELWVVTDLLQTIGSGCVLFAFTHAFFELIEALAERSHGAGQSIAEQQEGDHKDDAHFQVAWHPGTSGAAEQWRDEVLHGWFSICKGIFEAGRLGSILPGACSEVTESLEKFL